jgi:hypothetical protein
MEAVMCRDAFLSGWVVHFGVPATIAMDRGMQLTPFTWASMCSQLNMQHSLTTLFPPPQNDGMVEKEHR